MKLIINSIFLIVVLSTFSGLGCTVVDDELLQLVLEIKNQNQELLEEVKALQAKSDSLINELKNSAAKQEEVLKKVTDLQTELAKVLAQIGTLNQQLGAQNADLDEIKSQLADLQKKYEGILKQLEQLQKLNQILAEIEKLKGQLAELDGKYQVIQGSLTQNKEQLDTLKGQVASLQAQLTENLTKISQLTSQLGEQGADLEKILAAIEELKKSCAEIKALLENQLSGKSPIPTNGLVGWWPFNGNANDESGNTNNGVVKGVKLTSDRLGKNNSAYEFNSLYKESTVSEIKIDKKIIQLSKNYSISIWMNSNDVSTLYQCLFNSIPHTGFVVGLNDSNRRGKLTYGIGPSNAFWDLIYQVGSKSDYISKTWYNVVFTKNGQDYELYVNGILDGKSNLAKSANYSESVGIFFGTIGGSQQFDGKLDDVAIWNRALTADEVSKIYKGEGF